MSEGRIGAWWFWAAMAGASALGAFGALALIGAGCTRATAATPPPLAAPAPAIGTEPGTMGPGAGAVTAAAAPVLDARDQYALVADLEAALRLGEDDRDAAYDTVRRAWAGRRYSWEAFVVPMLCARADACVVVPFDHARRATPIVQGWLPRLRLDGTALAALRTACAAHAACVIRFEGTLAELNVSTALPTALTFSDVKIAGARDAAPGEAWFRR
jgi:hypothetical protein